ncbi:hypothetical protein [Polaribacter sp. Q13]|nr:hypothetical protein [Polaribacter sp. Q13]QVY67171.1 hypothetical protein JOP69_07855 [Polaribacter sp. Q13]
MFTSVAVLLKEIQSTFLVDSYVAGIAALISSSLEAKAIPKNNTSTIS